MFLSTYNFLDNDNDMEEVFGEFESNTILNYRMTEGRSSYFHLTPFFTLILFFSTFHYFILIFYYSF
jgi:hypothetical protein